MEGIYRFGEGEYLLVGKKSEYPTKKEFIEAIKKDGRGDSDYSEVEVEECKVAYRLNLPMFDGEAGYVLYDNNEGHKGAFSCWYVKENPSFFLFPKYNINKE